MTLVMKPSTIDIEATDDGSIHIDANRDADAVIVELARALARMAAREDDAIENGV